MMAKSGYAASHILFYFAEGMLKLIHGGNFKKNLSKKNLTQKVHSNQKPSREVGDKSYE